MRCGLKYLSAEISPTIFRGSEGNRHQIGNEYWKLRYSFSYVICEQFPLDFIKAK